MELKTYFFTCTHAAIYFVNKASSDHLEQDQARAWIEDLLVRSAVTFILQVRMRARPFPINANTHDIWDVNFGQTRIIFSKSGEMIRCAIFA